MSFHEALTQVEQVATYVSEVVLLDFGESAATGPSVRFLLPDPDDLATFRGKARQTKSKLGQRYAMVLVELADDQEPVVKPPAAESYGPAGAAYAVCRNPDFQHFASWMLRREGYEVPPDEDAASQLVKHYCGVSSRKELTTDKDGQARFHDMMREFREYTDELGRQEVP